MEKPTTLNVVLLTVQLCLFALGRLMDDMSWYDVHIDNEVSVCEGTGIACMAICVIIQLIRKRHHEGIFKILFFHSQLKFIIPWALVTTICFLFFNVFGCAKELTEEQQADYFYVQYTGCCLNVTQIVLTNLNYSIICNTKAVLAELALYELVLFAEVVYAGDLLMVFIQNMEGVPKDESILLVSIIIANQILVMDLMFRAAYEEKEREMEKEELLH